MRAGAVSGHRDIPVEPRRMVLASALAAAAGASNAMSFLGLGGVFTSVMTGNLVLLGVAAARPDPMLAAHAGAAFAGFVLGVPAGSRALRSLVPGRSRWRARVSLVLTGELLLLAAALAVWAVAGGRPGTGERLVLVATVALAMGVQSGAARSFGVPGLSTTFFTGTLTGVLAGLMTDRVLRLHDVVLLAALTAGAAGGGWLALRAPPTAPALPAALVLCALAVVSPLTRRPVRRRGRHGDAADGGRTGSR